MIVMTEEDALAKAKQVLDKVLRDEEFTSLSYGNQVLVLGIAIYLLGQLVAADPEKRGLRE